MNLMETVKNDLVIARRNGDKLALSTLIMAWSTLGFVAKAKKVEFLSDSDTQATLQTMIKQRKDSIEQFTKGDRQDLVGKEEQEIVILETYLPKEANEEQLRGFILAAKVSLGSLQKIGDVIKTVKSSAEKDGLRVDGKKLTELIKEVQG